jgi:5-methylthioadenosine/S-adenosylhomocysteine deaminase
VAESEEEVDRHAEMRGRSVPASLSEAGVFDGRVSAAHCVWLKDEDIALYRTHDVAVAHCPQSNAKLASGMAPLTRLLDEGVRVGLATDGPASNNSLDLWSEMRFAAQVARLHDSAAGAQADMVLVNMDDPAFVPRLDDAQLVEHVVWSGSSRLVTDDRVPG